tara:strand:- start:2654 stop:3385 length:732 start_codon:yes stop_codon:yes gene_type:complete
MTITIFTSNSLRHNHLINLFAKKFKLNVVIETKTKKPGLIKGFFKKSKAHEKYFNYVEKSEKKFFGNHQYINNVSNTLAIQQGDLNHLNKKELKKFLKSKYYIVFGASFIKGWLLKYLIKKKAINIHMGLSPYYKGSSCNFWAIYDKNLSYVGATIHYLSSQLDGGDIIKTVKANKKYKNLFDFSMETVKRVHIKLFNLISKKHIFKIKSYKQDKSLLIRYSKNNEFNEYIVKKFLKKNKFVL